MIISSTKTGENVLVLSRFSNEFPNDDSTKNGMNFANWFPNNDFTEKWYKYF